MSGHSLPHSEFCLTHLLLYKTYLSKLMYISVARLTGKAGSALYGHIVAIHCLPIPLLFLQQDPTETQYTRSITTLFYYKLSYI